MAIFPVTRRRPLFGSQTGPVGLPPPYSRRPPAQEWPFLPFQQEGEGFLPPRRPPAPFFGGVISPLGEEYYAGMGIRGGPQLRAATADIMRRYQLEPTFGKTPGGYAFPFLPSEEQFTGAIPRTVPTGRYEYFVGGRRFTTDTPGPISFIPRPDADDPTKWVLDLPTGAVFVEGPGDVQTFSTRLITQVNPEYGRAFGQLTAPEQRTFYGFPSAAETEKVRLTVNYRPSETTFPDGSTLWIGVDAQGNPTGQNQRVAPGKKERLGIAGYRTEYIPGTGLVQTVAVDAEGNIIKEIGQPFDPNAQARETARREEAKRAAGAKERDYFRAIELTERAQRAFPEQYGQPFRSFEAKQAEAINAENARQETARLQNVGNAKTAAQRIRDVARDPARLQTVLQGMGAEGVARLYDILRRYAGEDDTFEDVLPLLERGARPAPAPVFARPAAVRFAGWR